MAADVEEEEEEGEGWGVDNIMDLVWIGKGGARVVIGHAITNNQRNYNLYLFKIVFSGLEEFEEKIDTLGEFEEEEKSWLGSILQGVLNEADLEEEQEEKEGGEELIEEGEEENLDYVEPPFLDTRLGGVENVRALVRRRRTAPRQTRMRKQNEPTEEGNETRKQIETTEEERNLKEEKEEERSCTVELWWCLAEALEPAVRQIETSGSIAR